MRTTDQLRLDDARVGASPSGLVRGSVVLGFALAPALLAIAATPGFTTQDGPAHVYSARIINASLARDSPFAATFQVAWEPLPNWTGHLLTMGAVAIGTPEVANRVLAAVTLVVLAAAVIWLRGIVAGREGIEVAAVLAALLALNVTWLLGFTSFLLGASTGAVTLAFWWSGRRRFRLAQSLGLGLLLVLGYFCHPISLGLTVGGLVILVVLTPPPEWWRRAGWTGLSGVPLVPLGWAYRIMTRQGGAWKPEWEHWSPSVAGFVSQVGWVDPLSLAAKTAVPFDVHLGNVPGPLWSPALWVLASLGVLVASTWKRRHRDRLPWLVMAGAGVVGGLVAPDTLGANHGHFLPQRIVLLGLMTLVPWLDFQGDHRGVRLGLTLAVMALVLQSVFVWDYARTCATRITPFLRVAAHFEPRTRAGTLLNSIRGRFRANPLLHADGLTAAATDSIFWTNYETAQYYFPVSVRKEIDHPVATEFERVAILDAPADAARRAQLWDNLLRDHAPQLDQIIEWGVDPSLDLGTERLYQVTATEGPIRVWSRRRPHRSRD